VNFHPCIAKCCSDRLAQPAVYAPWPAGTRRHTANCACRLDGQVKIGFRQFVLHHARAMQRVKPRSLPVFPAKSLTINRATTCFGGRNRPCNTTVMASFAPRSMVIARARPLPACDAIGHRGRGSFCGPSLRVCSSSAAGARGLHRPAVLPAHVNLVLMHATVDCAAVTAASKVFSTHIKARTP